MIHLWGDFYTKGFASLPKSAQEDKFDELKGSIIKMKTGRLP
jgi:hypothetical protein